VGKSKSETLGQQWSGRST